MLSLSDSWFLDRQEPQTARRLQNLFLRRLLVAAFAGAASVLLSTSGPAKDWLIDPEPFVSKAVTNADGTTLELANGLVRRVVRLQPNAATVQFENAMTGESLLRSVRAEARLQLNGKSFDIGGLVGQPVHNYLDSRWPDQMTAATGA